MQTQRTRTDEVLLDMLRENTGTHFLDSGGDCGRHWQRNADRNIEQEAASTVSFKYGEISVSHRVFHWLRERLEFDEEATAAFDGAFREERDADDDASWGELRDEFPAWFACHASVRDSAEECPSCSAATGTSVNPSGDDRDGCDDCRNGVVASDDLYRATGIYGEGEPITVNSYNEENLLDQVLLFTYFELRTDDGGRASNYGSYVVLQLHGGADVRGGYTRPRVFRVCDDDELAICDFRRGTIFCAADSDHWWSTDDGYHWYFEGACGRGAGTQLESFERVTIADVRALDDVPADWRRGVLCVTEAGDGFCPHCGGRLASSTR